MAGLSLIYSKEKLHFALVMFNLKANDVQWLKFAEILIIPERKYLNAWSQTIIRNGPISIRFSSEKGL